MSQYYESQDRNKAMAVVKSYELNTSTWLEYLLAADGDHLKISENEVLFTIRSFRKTLEFIESIQEELNGFRALEIVFKMKVILAFLSKCLNISYDKDYLDEKYHDVPKYDD